MARQPEDIIVEVRDRNLRRKGAIPTQDLRLKMQPVHNGVGSWSITLPAEHPRVADLRAPGAGILVTARGKDIPGTPDTYAPGAEARRNLCRNPIFELDLAGWTAESGAVLTRITTGQISGSASMKVSNGGDTYHQVAMTAGDVFTFSMSYKTIGTVAGVPRLYAAAPGASAVVYALPLTQTSPGRFSLTTPPAVSTGNGIFALFSPTIGGEVVIDEVLIEKSASALAPFSGDTTDDPKIGYSYEWVGAANATESIQRVNNVIPGLAPVPVWKTMFSGPTSKPTKKATSADKKGMVTISGLSDDRILWDTVSFPQPSNPDVATQLSSHDVFSGNAETVMRHYADVNLGPNAPAARKTGSLKEFFRLDPVNSNLGATVNKTTRFDYVGDILHEIATLRNLRFRVLQVGNILQLQITAVADRSKFVRLDIENGTLQEQSVETAPPRVTRVIVAGQGEGTARQILARVNSVSSAAEIEWGLIIEQFKDQRNTNVLAELQQAGDEILASDGFTRVAVKATPSNNMTMIYMEDFDTGDKVSVVIDGQETFSNITEAAIICDSSGLTSAVAIGDIRDFDSSSALRQTVADTQSRVSRLEREIESESSDRLGIYGMDVSNGDFNGLIQTGFYRGSVMTNSPNGTGWWQILVQAHDAGSWRVQTAVGFTGVGNLQEWRRQQQNAVWGAWSRVYNTDTEIAASPAVTAALVPAGVTSQYAGTTAPVGYLLCNGQLVSRTTYAALFAVTGTLYGAGDGSTTFAIPNLKGRIPVGLDAAQTEFDVLGETGGSKTHTLSVAEMPSHVHNIKSQSASYNAGDFADAGYQRSYADNYTLLNSQNVSATGGGGAHNNLQPYLAINYIIKT